MDQTQNLELLEQKDEENIFELDIRVIEQRLNDRPMGPDTLTVKCHSARPSCYCQ
ncbi:hypothetical protein [Ktedonosporobacter rubrisoli]|uniref:hypothetical protein n=1 Tax=Ktedonosporobacter rubrisoli TaxID=2509675 RepID=UPI0013EEA289|nr:hypothetical protein [Ktedonosporobacter rubrisoli]